MNKALLMALLPFGCVGSIIALGSFTIKILVNAVEPREMLLINRK